MPELTVVMPVYNEASRGSSDTSFASRLYMMMRHLESIDYRVIMSDDGSTDNSVEVFRTFVMDNHLEDTWCCIESEKNGGKGRAVLRGLLAANTSYVLVLDADMSVEPYKVVQLIHSIRPGECYIGTRYAHGSQIVNERSILRKFVSWCCVTLVNMLFGLGVTDSQCGFKLMSRECCDKLTDYAVDSWIFDVEILYHLKSQGVSILETPVRWNNMERESNVRALSAIIPSTKALFNLFSNKSAIKALYRRA